MKVKNGAALAAVFLALCVVSLHSAAGDAEASHAFPKLELWPDLRAGGDGHITYCLQLEGSPGESSWDDGVENWDASLGAPLNPPVEFDPVSCTASEQVRLQWEPVGQDKCGITPGGNPYIACWEDWDKTDLGSYWQLNHTRIYFDRTAYPPYAPDWETAISGHEWGHNLSLDHHTTTGPCTENSVMAYVIGEACLTGPSGNDVSTVWCAVYRTCTLHGFTSWGPAADLVPTAIASDYTRADHTHMVRVSNCDLFEKYWDGSVWTGWINRSNGVGETMCFNGAAAISVSDGQTHIVGSTSGNLWHKWRSGGGSYSGFAYLGNPSGELIDGPIAIANLGAPGYGYPGHIHIVGVSKAPGLNTGMVYLKMYRGSWEPWQNLGGNDTMGGSLAIANRGGLIHVASFTPVSAHVWLKYWNSQSWQGWEDLGGLLDGALAIDDANAVSRNPVLTPHVGVHILALSGGIVHSRCWDSYCGGWQPQGGAGYVGPLAITNTYGEVHMVSRFVSTDLRHRERNP